MAFLVSRLRAREGGSKGERKGERETETKPRVLFKLSKHATTTIEPHPQLSACLSTIFILRQDFYKPPWWPWTYDSTFPVWLVARIIGVSH